MRGECGRVEALLDRRAGGLVEAELLVLELHLSRCAACSRTANMMRAITRIVERAAPSLPPRIRERAMAAAFVRAATVPARAPSVPRRSPVTWGLLAVAAAALLAAVQLWPTAPHTPQVARGPAATRQPSALIAHEASPTPPAPALQAAWHEARPREVAHYAHAQVRTESSARLRFHALDSTLELARGRIHVAVDPTRHRPFAVVTQHFRVEVLGTQFTVSPEGVEVQRGLVQVRDRDGNLLKRLRGGEAYAHAARALGSHRTAQPGQARPRHADAPESPRKNALLAAARTALAHGDVGEVRRLLQRLPRARLTRRDRAEADTLRAECALLERDVGAAARGYERLAAKYEDLPAGENAAFAAAQLRAEQGDREAARRSYERYLVRYPNGHFADEARRHLAQEPAFPLRSPYGP